ncbi:MAG: hypothetical protein V1820_03260 [archaeon]
MAEMETQTISLIVTAILILAIFYLLRSVTRRMAIMKLLKEKGHLFAAMKPAPAGKKKAPAKRKKAVKRKKGRR